MAYIFFRYNNVGLPKDITDYIITFLSPSDVDIEMLKLFVYDQCICNIRYNYHLYVNVCCHPRFSAYRLWGSFHRYILDIKDNQIVHCGHRWL